MPLLAPAPAPRIRITPVPAPTAAPPEPELPSPAFFGRSFEEYAGFFALDPFALKGRDVLDVAAGPSSFVAEACARRIHAVAVDPLYGEPAESLAAQVQLDYATTLARMETGPRRTRSGAAVAPAALEADRRAAAQRFLADYATHAPYGRYVRGALPQLPFFNGTFDLVLCAHLLFADAGRFGPDWHVAACRELVRVSAGEVRIHPFSAADGKPHSGWTRLRRELKEAGIAAELRAVESSFSTGPAATLVLRRVAP